MQDKATKNKTNIWHDIVNEKNYSTLQNNTSTHTNRTEFYVNRMIATSGLPK